MKLNQLFDVNPSRASGTTLKADPLPYMFSGTYLMGSTPPPSPQTTGLAMVS